MPKRATRNRGPALIVHVKSRSCSYAGRKAAGIITINALLSNLNGNARNVNDLEIWVAVGGSARRFKRRFVWE